MRTYFQNTDLTGYNIDNSKTITLSGKTASLTPEVVAPEYSGFTLNETKSNKS